MTPEQITPELARELLAKAYPKPRFVDEWTAEEVDLRPVTVTAELVPLVEAAPALAELVANMRYEYAVVCLVEGDVWRYARGGVLITPLEHEARWFPTSEEAEAYAERRRSTAKETRVVPRLVSTPEVVE